MYDDVKPQLLPSVHGYCRYGPSIAGRVQRPFNYGDKTRFAVLHYNIPCLSLSLSFDPSHSRERVRTGHFKSNTVSPLKSVLTFRIFGFARGELNLPPPRTSRTSDNQVAYYRSFLATTSSSMLRYCTPERHTDTTVCGVSRRRPFVQMFPVIAYAVVIEPRYFYGRLSKTRFSATFGG